MIQSLNVTAKVILKKWYMIVYCATMFVVYWVMQGLYDIGFLQAAEKTVMAGLRDVKAVARYCTPKIIHPKEFWDCLSHAGSMNIVEECANTRSPSGLHQEDCIYSPHQDNPYSESANSETKK